MEGDENPLHETEDEIECREFTEMILVVICLVGLVFIALEITVGVALQGWYNEAKAAEAPAVAP